MAQLVTPEFTQLKLPFNHSITDILHWDREKTSLFTYSICKKAEEYYNLRIPTIHDFDMLWAACKFSWENNMCKVISYIDKSEIILPEGLYWVKSTDEDYIRFIHLYPSGRSFSGCKLNDKILAYCIFMNK